MRAAGRTWRATRQRAAGAGAARGSQCVAPRSGPCARHTDSGGERQCPLSQSPPARGAPRAARSGQDAQPRPPVSLVCTAVPRDAARSRRPFSGNSRFLSAEEATSVPRRADCRNAQYARVRCCQRGRGPHPPRAPPLLQFKEILWKAMGDRRVRTEEMRQGGEAGP